MMAVLPSASAHPVAHAPHRDHDLRVLRVVLDLGAQALDVHVDEARVGGVAVTPDLFQQHFATEHLPWLAGEGEQEVELEGCEGDRGAVAGDGVGGEVDRQVADEVRTHFPNEVLGATIPRSVRVSEAPSFGQTVITYDAQSTGALAYLEAAAEIADRGVGTTEGPGEQA